MPLFMIVEHFRNGEAAPVYRRFKERGRMAPDGLTYVSSWVDENLATCYQLMETANRALLDQWMRNWMDLVEFEVYPVIRDSLIYSPASYTWASRLDVG